MKTLMFLLLLASASGNVWTIQSFKDSCQPNNRNLIVTVKGKRTHLECRSQGVERKSAWFDRDRSNKDKLTGSLERTLNSSQVVTMDQEFDSSGNLMLKTFYIRAETKAGQRIQNMFVFDRSGKFIRGNIDLPGENFVVPNSEMVLLNGNLIESNGIDFLLTKLTKKFGLTGKYSFPELIETIWKKENPTPNSSEAHVVSPPTAK